MRFFPAKPDTTIPPELEISSERFREILPIWSLWVATDRRFLPTDLMKQPKRLLDDLLYLDVIADKIMKQIIEREEKNQNA